MEEPLLKKNNWDIIFRVPAQYVLNFFANLGTFTILFVEIVESMFTNRPRFRMIIAQIYFVGVRSIVVVLITGAFTGAVFATQLFYQFHRFGMETMTGAVTTIAMFRELGPVLAAIMIAGRVGSAIAAELATMKTTEQIDALRAMGISPVEYLVVPRFIALFVCMPILTGFCVLAGSFAGYFVAVYLLGVDSAYYMANIAVWAGLNDMWYIVAKGGIFAFIVATVACHKGLNSGSGAESVGIATTEAAVTSSIVVLIANFFLSVILRQLIWLSLGLAQ